MKEWTIQFHELVEGGTKEEAFEAFKKRLIEIGGPQAEIASLDPDFFDIDDSPFG